MLKKRLLLLLTIGVSFSPAVIADGIRPGEMKASQTLSSNPGKVLCSLQALKKELPADTVTTTQSGTLRSIKAN